MSAKRFTFKILHEQQKRADLGKLLRGRKVPIPHRYDNPYFIQEETGIKAPLMKTFKLGATTKPKISLPSRPLRARFLPLPSEKVTLRLPSNDDNIAIKNELSNTATTTSLLKDGSFSDLGLVFGALGHYSKVAKAINDAEYGYDDDDEAAMTSTDMLDPYNTPVEPLGTFAPPTTTAAPAEPLLIHPVEETLYDDDDGDDDDDEMVKVETSPEGEPIAVKDEPIQEQDEEEEAPQIPPEAPSPVPVAPIQTPVAPSPPPPQVPQPQPSMIDNPQWQTADQIRQGVIRLAAKMRPYLISTRAQSGELDGLLQDLATLELLCGQQKRKNNPFLKQKWLDDLTVMGTVLRMKGTKQEKKREFDQRFPELPSEMRKTYKAQDPFQPEVDS